MRPKIKPCQDTPITLCASNIEGCQARAPMNLLCFPYRIDTSQRPTMYPEWHSAETLRPALVQQIEFTTLRRERVPCFCNRCRQRAQTHEQLRYLSGRNRRAHGVVSNQTTIHVATSQQPRLGRQQLQLSAFAVLRGEAGTKQHMYAKRAMALRMMALLGPPTRMLCCDAKHMEIGKFYQPSLENRNTGGRTCCSM